MLPSGAINNAKVSPIIGSGGQQQQPPANAGSRRGSSCNPNNKRQITLYNQQGSNGEYGFGLRVVGQQEQPITARVLWISQGGPAQRGGISVGDRILEWDGFPLANVPIACIPSMIENCESGMVTLVLCRYSDQLGFYR
jgi:C-terminal processing protease CtpA/Prc